MKRLVPLISWIMTLLVFCTGCSRLIEGRTEIDKILFVTVFGIDTISDGEDTIRITISSPSAGPPDQPGGGTKKELHIFTSQGRSVFEALRKLRLFGHKKIFLGHVGFIIIGEAAAQNNVQKDLDLLARDHELRLNSKVFVVKGNTAKEVIEASDGNDEFLSKYLENLQDNAGGLSQSGEIELIKLLQALDRKDAAPYIPYITVRDNASYPGLYSKNMDIYLEGYAVFKGTSLYGYIKDSESRGFNWIKNKIESGAIVVRTKQGNIVTLEIIKSKARITPVIDNENIRISLKLQMYSDVAEIEATEDIFNEPALSYLEAKQSEIIKSEMQSIVAYSQKANIDFLEISSAVQHKYPVKWKSIKAKWKEIFPKLAINIDVESKISRTYNIEEPARTGEE